MVRAFDAFGGDLEAQALTHGDDGAGDRLRARAGIDGGNQAAVELDAGQRQGLQRGQRRVAGAEVIQRDGNAVGAQPAQRVDGGRTGLQHRFGQFDLDAARRQPVNAQQLHQAFDETRIGELARHHVDGHARLRPGAVMPMGRGLHGRLQHPVADVHDEAGFLGDRQELTGRGETAIGHAPADQRLHQRGLQRLRTDLGLEGELEFAAGDGAAQALFGGEFRGCGLEQFRGEHRQLAAAQRLGAEQRGVRRLEQRVGLAFVIGVDAGADADADDEIAAVDAQGFLERLDDADPGGADRLGVRTIREHHGELVAP